MAKQQKRVVFTSIQTKQGWEGRRGSEKIGSFETQQQTEEAVIKAAREVYENGGKSQAVLHKANGEIREERTYGKDPERTPG